VQEVLCSTAPAIASIGPILAGLSFFFSSAYQRIGVSTGVTCEAIGVTGPDQPPVMVCAETGQLCWPPSVIGPMVHCGASPAPPAMGVKGPGVTGVRVCGVTCGVTGVTVCGVIGVMGVRVPPPPPPPGVMVCGVTGQLCWPPSVIGPMVHCG